MCKVWDVVKLPLLYSGLLWVVRYVMAVCHFANLLSNIGFEFVVFKNVNILVKSEYETPDTLETTYVDVQTIVLVVVVKLDASRGSSIHTLILLFHPIILIKAGARTTPAKSPLVLNYAEALTKFLVMVSVTVMFTTSLTPAPATNTSM